MASNCQVISANILPGVFNLDHPLFRSRSMSVSSELTLCIRIGHG